MLAGQVERTILNLYYSLMVLVFAFCCTCICNKSHSGDGHSGGDGDRGTEGGHDDGDRLLLNVNVKFGKSKQAILDK